MKMANFVTPFKDLRSGDTFLIRDIPHMKLRSASEDAIFNAVDLACGSLSWIADESNVIKLTLVLSLE
jgi:hypothetical protein